ncbi:MAG: hypothetical protein R6V58_12430 [Planctomycetota bacterium]
MSAPPFEIDSKYQSKTAELERMVAEVVSEQNYRRASGRLNQIGQIPVPESTAHRWVMESDCDELKTDGKIVDVLFADGTGYKRRPDPEAYWKDRLRIQDNVVLFYRGVKVA